MPRSGSTLLQNVIAQNPNFYVTPTSGLLELIYGARSNFSASPEFIAQDSNLMNNAFRSFCVSGIKSYFESITDKKYVVDKSRGWGAHYNLLQALNADYIGNEPKVIIMVRNLYDIVASMEKLNNGNGLKANPLVDYGNMRGITLSQRVNMLLQTPPIGLALHRLYEIVNSRLDRKVLYVKYEDFCRNPTTEMYRIYDYLELPYYNHDFDNVEQVTKEDDAVYGLATLHEIRNKVEPKPQYGRNYLGSDVCSEIKTMHQWYLSKFSY
jgi:sulfotransferase